MTRAFYFIGFVPNNQALYTSLQKAGYTLVFKPVAYRADGKPKGNVDTELVLQAMIEYSHYDRAVIVTSDGDSGCLVRYLYEQAKLERVLSPNRRGCSALLKRAAREKLDFLEDAKNEDRIQTLKGHPLRTAPEGVPLPCDPHHRVLASVALST